MPIALITLHTNPANDNRLDYGCMSLWRLSCDYGSLLCTDILGCNADILGCAAVPPRWVQHTLRCGLDCHIHKQWRQGHFVKLYPCAHVTVLYNPVDPEEPGLKVGQLQP